MSKTINFLESPQLESNQVLISITDMLDAARQGFRIVETTKSYVIVTKPIEVINDSND